MSVLAVKSSTKITFLISNNVSSPSPMMITEYKLDANTTIQPKDPLSMPIFRNYPISLSFIVQDQNEGSAGLEFRLKDAVFFFTVRLSEDGIQIGLSTANFTDAQDSADSSKADMKAQGLDISAGFTGDVGYLTVNPL
jgi:hypothetical protein